MKTHYPRSQYFPNGRVEDSDVESIASQKKWHSFLESIGNVVVGLGINIVIQHVAFPYFGIHISWAQNIGIACVFTVVSIIRSFFLRRAFNRWHVNGHTK